MNDKQQMVIASVLKPINDPRMYEKLGISLFRTGKYWVHIVGFCSNKQMTDTNIRFYPVYCSERLSPKRLGVPWKFFKILLKVKPKVIVIQTHEYLLVTGLYKILFGGKIIYDIRENYLRNILYTNAFPMFVRPLLAAFVRGYERLSRLWVDQFWLAERCYVTELSFVGDRCRVLENKYQPLTEVAVIPRRSPFNLFFSGTIAESYGIYEAVELARSLFAIDHRYNLTLIGSADRQEDLDYVRKHSVESPSIKLVGIDRPVPHPDIVRYYKKAGTGLLPYRLNKNNQDCIPTKLYEYIYYQIPFIISNNVSWESFCRPFGGSLLVDFSLYNPLDIHNATPLLSFTNIFDKGVLLWGMTNI